MGRKANIQSDPNSISFDFEGSDKNVLGIASVIRNNRGEAIAGMSITPPLHEINEKKLDCLSRLIRMGCSLISYKIGYQEDCPVRDIREIREWWKHEE